MSQRQKFSRNIFSNQRAAYQRFSDEHKLPVIKELPEISFSFIESQSASRINFQNQWASHPTLEERKTHLESLQMNCYPIEEPAWVVFRNPEQLQEQFTAKLYSHLETDQSNITYYDREMYEAIISHEADRYSLPEAYNGFYDKRFPDISSWNLDQPVTLPANISFEQLFSPENGQLQSSIQLLERDFETVKAIQDGSIDTATFDFDGAKYKSHRQLAEKFLESQYSYFDDKEFFTNEPDHLIDCLNFLNQLSTEENWNIYKDLITKQLDQFRNQQ